VRRSARACFERCGDLPDESNRFERGDAVAQAFGEVRAALLEAASVPLEGKDL